MQVSEIMAKDPACCTDRTSLQEVARLMADHDCGCIPVIENEENKKPIGMITDRDITIRTVAHGKNPLQMIAGEIMTDGAVTVTPETSLEECSNLMEKNQVRRVAVVDQNGACIGMVAQADIAINAPSKTTAEMVQEVSKGANQ
jgi:CBS domain-containing protein